MTLPPITPATTSIPRITPLRLVAGAGANRGGKVGGTSGGSSGGRDEERSDRQLLCDPGSGICTSGGLSSITVGMLPVSAPGGNVHPAQCRSTTTIQSEDFATERRGANCNRQAANPRSKIFCRSLWRIQLELLCRTLCCQVEQNYGFPLLTAVGSSGRQDCSVASLAAACLCRQL